MPTAKNWAVVTSYRPNDLIHNRPECIAVARLQGLKLFKPMDVWYDKDSVSAYNCTSCNRPLVSRADLLSLLSASFLPEDDPND